MHAVHAIKLALALERARLTPVWAGTASPIWGAAGLPASERRAPVFGTVSSLATPLPSLLSSGHQAPCEMRVVPSPSVSLPLRTPLSLTRLTRHCPPHLRSARWATESCVYVTATPVGDFFSSACCAQPRLDWFPSLGPVGPSRRSSPARRRTLPPARLPSARPRSVGPPGAPRRPSAIFSRRRAAPDRASTGSHPLGLSGRQGAVAPPVGELPSRAALLVARLIVSQPPRRRLAASPRPPTPPVGPPVLCLAPGRLARSASAPPSSPPGSRRAKVGGEYSRVHLSNSMCHLE